MSDSHVAALLRRWRDHGDEEALETLGAVLDRLPDRDPETRAYANREAVLFDGGAVIDRNGEDVWEKLVGTGIVVGRDAGCPEDLPGGVAVWLVLLDRPLKGYRWDCLPLPGVVLRPIFPAQSSSSSS